MGVCAERDATQEGSGEQTWQIVMVGVGGSKRAILVWRNYWIDPITIITFRIIIFTIKFKFSISKYGL